MVNTIRQLQDLKEWAQDSTRYERRLNFRLAQKPYNWEEGDWWDADDESVGNTKILEDFEITDEMRRRPNAEGGVQQLVQPGPGRQGYSGQGRSHWIYESGSKNKKLKKEVVEDITKMMADSKNFPDKQTITKTFKYSGNPDKVLKMWAAETGNTIPEGRFRLHTYEGTDIQKNLVKSFISGSIAQLDKIVSPFARLAAISKFSVAPTETFGNFIFAPTKPFGALA